MSRQAFNEELFVYPFSTLAPSELLGELNGIRVHGEVDEGSAKDYIPNRGNRESGFCNCSATETLTVSILRY